MMRKLLAAAVAFSVALAFCRTGAQGESPDGTGTAPAPGKVDAQPLFVGWPKPKAVIVATGLQMGYIEPCGCSGKENQKGGLSRRHNLLLKLAADGWPVVSVDVGEQVQRFGKQAELKFLATADALKTMKYAGVALGTDDLRLPAESLVSAVILDTPSDFVSANAAPFGFEQKLTPRFKVIEAGGLKIGVTAIVGAAFQKGVNNEGLEFKPADKALAEIMPQLKDAKCDRLLLLAEASPAEIAALAKQFPDFDFIVTASGAAEPPREPATIPGTNTRLIEVGQKGMYANVIGLFDDAAQPLRFQKVPLDARWGESPAMKQVMVNYQEQLKQLGLAGLGLKPAPHPSGRTFVGSKVCGDCHTKAFKIWMQTPHAKALDTLVKLDPPRHYDPECLSCHVTGWEPQKFYPYSGGYLSREQTPFLAGNGCENCHGPGSEHVAVEQGNKTVTPAEQAAIRASMQIPPAKAENGCIQCHDADNSLKFDFKTYWPKVEHKGMD